MKHHLSLVTALIVAGAAALVSPAAAQPLRSGQTCLSQNMVYGWKVINDRTLIVNDRVGRQYRLTLARGCHNLEYPIRMGFSAGTGFGLSCLQRNGFLYVPGGGGYVAQRCLIRDVRPYTAEMQHEDAVSRNRDRY